VIGRRNVSVVAVAALALLASGCSGHHDGSAGPRPTPTSRINLSSLSGSGCGRAATAGSTTLSITIGGHARTVIVHVPTGYRDTTKVPLVLNLHGSGSTASGQEYFSGMDTTADANGFIVAYPQALIPEGTGFDWNIPGVSLVGNAAIPAGSANDVTFLTDLVGDLEHRYCVDRSRVYATGFSGGARMTSQLACDSAEIFAAVAPVSGLRRPTPCPATRAVPVISFHGTADPVDPYGGHGAAYWTYSVPQAAAKWASQDGCTAKAARSQPDPTVTLTRYDGCRSGVAVELYTIAGEGHEWPGGPSLPVGLTKLLGPQSKAINADATIWAFFAAHPKP
jgi:polyhydroxybutyrate depolymerase